MRLIALVLVALAATAGAASANTTRNFLDRCASDEARCAADIHAARRALEKGPDARKKLCIPVGLSDEELVASVTNWIDEQIPSMNHKQEAESIAAALVALYSCTGIKGL